MLAKIDTADCNNLCTDIKNVVSRFDVYFSYKAMKCDFESEIDAILTCSMDKILEDAYIDKMNEIAILSGDFGDVKQQVGDVKQEVSNVKQEVGNVNQKVGDVKQEVGNVKQDVGDVNRKVGCVKQEVGIVRQEVGNVKQQGGDVKQSVGTIKQEVGTVKQQVGDVKQEVGNIKQKVGDVNRKVGDVKQEVGNVKQGVGDVNKKVGDVKQEVGIVRQEVVNVKQQIGDVKQEVGSVKQEVGSVKQQIGDVKQEVSNVNLKVGDVKQEVGNVKQDVGDVNRKVGDVKHEVGTVKQQVRDVKQQVGNVNQKVGDVKQEVGNVKQGVGDVNRKVGDVKQQVGDVKQEVGHVNQKVGDVKQEVGNVKQEVGDVNRKVGDVKKEVGDIKQKVGDVKQEVGSVKQQVGNVMQKVCDVKQDFGDVKKNLENLQNKFDVVEKVCMETAKQEDIEDLRNPWCKTDTDIAEIKETLKKKPDIVEKDRIGGQEDLQIKEFRLVSDGSNQSISLDKIPSQSFQDIPQERSENVFQQIRSHYLRGRPARLHLADEDFSIDNTFEDPNTKDLQKKIVQLAAQQPHWGESIPGRWLPLEERLMSLKAQGVKVIPYLFLEKMNQEGDVKIESKKELDLFLKFQHDIGNILYFSTEELWEWIVLEPQWLIKATKSLITADMFILRKHPQAEKEWYQFKEEGKLTQELLDIIWSKEHDPDLHDYKELILLLMVQLNIIARPRLFTDDGDKAEDFFLAPCMLCQTAPPEVISPEVKPEMKSSSVLCFVFTGKFLPSPIFHRLLAVCVANWPILKRRGRNQIFCGYCIFEADHRYRLTLYFKSYVIFARISLAAARHHSLDAEICIHVREFINYNLSKILGNLSQNLKFELFMKCQCPESVGDSLDSIFSVKELRSVAELTCRYHDDHNVESNSLLKYWFQNEEHYSGDRYQMSLQP